MSKYSQQQAKAGSADDVDNEHLLETTNGLNVDGYSNMSDSEGVPSALTSSTPSNNKSNSSDDSNSANGNGDQINQIKKKSSNKLPLLEDKKIDCWHATLSWLLTTGSMCCFALSSVFCCGCINCTGCNKRRFDEKVIDFQTKHLPSDDVKLLRNTAEIVIRNNTVAHHEGPFLVAGKYQYRSMWSRDFAYATTGLLILGEHELVARQIVAIVSRRDKDNLIPKGLDTMPLEKRVIISSCKASMGCRTPSVFKDGPLLALHKDLLASEAIDSNILVLNAAIQHSLHPGAKLNLLIEYADEMKAIFDHYEGYFRDGLIWQMPYSDWQDSVSREGHVFLTNLLYYKACQGLVSYPHFGITEEFLEKYKERIMNTFYDKTTGLFYSIAGREFISIDGNLLAIDWGFVDDAMAHKLYESLKKTSLWNVNCGCPGVATVPQYPLREKAPQVRMSWLHGYHDTFIWTWLTALSAKIAYRMGDIEEGDRIASFLAFLIKRDNSILELYHQDTEMHPVQTCGYHDEEDFSWSAGKFLEMLHERDIQMSKLSAN